MKHFVSNRLYNNVSSITLRIHQIKNNKLSCIGSVKYNRHRTKGEESEVYNFLIENKYIPKKAEKFSECSWRSAGYYAEGNPYCIITSL